MALIALTSASGAPGVSTCALGLALAWPRPVLLVEADPGGGSTVLAGWFHGMPPHDRGLVNLAMALAYAGQSPPVSWLPGAIGEVVVRIPDTQVDVVTGVRTPSQAPAVEQLWAPLAETVPALAEGGVDVIVDAGRLGLAHAPTALVEAADAVLLVSLATLPAVAAARAWSRRLLDDLGRLGRGDHLGLLLVGPGRTYGAGEVADLLGLPMTATLPWDPKTARAIHLGLASRRLSGGPLVRALRAAVNPIADLAGRNAARLTVGPTLVPTGEQA